MLTDWAEALATVRVACSEVGGVALEPEGYDSPAPLGTPFLGRVERAPCPRCGRALFRVEWWERVPGGALRDVRRRGWLYCIRVGCLWPATART